ncbi:MAG: beta-lactamase family protein [Rhodospirillales bacterium]|nr:beta-lactamase family protein [Rhodospirillales bacterium]
MRQAVVVACDGDGSDVPWWSFTKTVIAAAALALVRDGRLVLDEPLTDRPYTLRQLLQHRAGLTEYGRLPAYHEAVARNEDAWPIDEMLARSDADRLVYEPGEGWDYSNIGYTFVRRLIEQTTDRPLDDALEHLVMKPLGVAGVRLATDRAHYSPDYDPRWVYHGLLVEPLQQAALLLQRLMVGDLLPPPLLSAMCDRYSVGGPIAGRPWKTPSYGLGLMIGETTGGELIAGHTGGGPGSAVAVYHRLDRSTGTAAAHEVGNDDASVEEVCATLLRTRP